MAQYLIEQAHCDVERADDFGLTALHVACKRHRLPMVRYIVEPGGASVEAPEKYGMTALHLASFDGRTDIVEYLVEERQADVNSKDEVGYTPLDAAIYGRQSSEVDIFRFLLPRSLSINKRSLSTLWNDSNRYFLRGEMPVDIGRMVLEKYAFGHGLASAFLRLPIHTLISHFPLPSPEAFQDCIALFPASVLSLLDENCRLPIHIALVSSHHVERLFPRRLELGRSFHRGPVVVGSASPIVSFLFEREPRAALTRDPISGLYPHETAAGLISRDDDGWLDVVYKMFRSNPQQLLQSRGVVGCGEGTLDESEKVTVACGEPKPKRAKIENKLCEENSLHEATEDSVVRWPLAFPHAPT